MPPGWETLWDRRQEGHEGSRGQAGGLEPGWPLGSCSQAGPCPGTSHIPSNALRIDMPSTYGVLDALLAGPTVTSHSAPCARGWQSPLVVAGRALLLTPRSVLKDSCQLGSQLSVAALGCSEVS